MCWRCGLHFAVFSLHAQRENNDDARPALPRQLSRRAAANLNKAFQRTCGDHVIHDPDAMGGGFNRILDLIESDSQEIVLDGGVTEAIQPMTTHHLTDQSADPRGCPHGDGTFDHHPQHEHDQVDGKGASGSLCLIE